LSYLIDTNVLSELRRQTLLDWLETDLPTFFAGRVLPVDAAVADRWGRLVAAAGRPLPAIDSLLAATAVADLAASTAQRPTSLTRWAV